MELDFSPEQRKFRDDLRDYFNKMMTPELTEELRGDGEGGLPLAHVVGELALVGNLGGPP